MCVVNKQFELLEFVFDSAYVDLQYVEIFPHFYCWVYVIVLCLKSCGMLLLLLFAFQSMFISIWVSSLEIAEFPDSVHLSAP